MIFSRVKYERAIQEMIRDNITIIFLVGESKIGKDTILHILQYNSFKDNYEPTKKLQEISPSESIAFYIINTAGSPENDDENIQARKDLPSGKNTKYVYVFRVDKFFSDENYQKCVQWDIENAKEQCDRVENGWDLVIIGTHKDKCNASDEQIQALIAELGEKDKFRCAIFDLTEARDKGIEMQRKIKGIFLGINLDDILNQIFGGGFGASGGFSSGVFGGFDKFDKNG